MNKFLRPLAVLIVGIVIALPAAGQSFAPIPPEEAGFSMHRLARLDSVIQASIKQQRLAGAVALIARDGRAAHLKSYGMQDLENGVPMPTDAIFRIASMSKAVTTTAVMMLYEEGHFLLSDPVSKFIPAFKNAVVAVAPPEDASAETAFVTEPARKPITIHHLLTHTAGLTYGGGLASKKYQEAALVGWYFADKEETIGEAIKRLAGLPLHGQPGEVWQYGFSTDVLGYFVEVVSGMPLDQFFEKRIFEPLQMHDTSFFLSPDKAGRLAPVYGHNQDGVVELREPTATTDYLHGPRQCFSGGAGLLSTITDYGRFLQMLLNGGELDGVRLLSPKTVELMRVNHTEEMYPWGPTGFGLGFWVIDDLGRYGELGSVGAYGWGSAYYPVYWIDPQENLVAIFMTQLLPARDLNLNRLFYTMTYQAMVE